MQVKQILHDDNAVSPVIGVILMVAITVILAAVIASFVLGLGPGEAAPTASFDFEKGTNAAGEDVVNVTFANGDTLEPDQIHIRGDVDDDGNWSQADAGDTNIDSIGGGASVSFLLDGSSPWDVRVVWETPDTSQTLDDSEIS